MEQYVTISAKVSRKVRARMRKLGIKPSAIFQKAIKEALIQEKVKDLHKELAEVRKIASKIPIEEIVNDIREDRDTR